MKDYHIRKDLNLMLSFWGMTFLSKGRADCDKLGFSWLACIQTGMF